MYDAVRRQVTDPAAMEEKHGYTPAEAVEVQTLIGDSIDNVPGIPGVGAKTAAKLIKKYGTADAVLQHLDELTPKMRENFEKYGDRLPLARQLVTLKDDVEIEFDPEACRFDGVNSDGAARRTCRSWGSPTCSAGSSPRRARRRPARSAASGCRPPPSVQRVAVRPPAPAATAADAPAATPRAEPGDVHRGRLQVRAGADPGAVRRVPEAS